jgi:secreted trypsin-like serine protease
MKHPVLFCALLAVPFQLASAPISFEVEPLIVAAGDISDLTRYGTPRGAGYDGVGGLLLNTSGGSFLCSGSLLAGGRDVLTAAHCLTNTSGQVTFTGGTATFFPNPEGQETIAISSVSVHPDWTGDLLNGNDLAVIHLTSAPSAGVTQYDVFTGNPIGATYNVAGFGTLGSYGEGATGSTGTRRQGMNEFEAYLSQMGPGYSPYILMADFDDGTAAHDGFGYFYGLGGLGLGLNEASAAPGDSGGPALIGGQIAGITSFGVRLAYDNGNTSDIDSNMNFSFGEFNGFTDASTYAYWIYNNRSIPEPGTLGLLAFGLAAFVLRKRRL